MSIFLISAKLPPFTHYFNLSSARGIILTVALILLGVALLAGIVLAIVKPNILSKYVKIAFSVVIAFAVAIGIYFIIDGFKDGETYLKSYQPIILIVAICLVAILIVVGMFVDKKKNVGKSNTLAVVYGGLCIALAFGLSYIRLFKAPYGGSITLASILPIILYSYMFGIGKGTICGIIYGVLQAIQDPWIINPIQFFLDYILAFSMYGVFGGMFRKYFSAMPAIVLGILTAVIARFFCSYLSGAMFFEIYMPDTFTNVWFYSFVYNSLYVFPDGAIAIVAGIGLMSSKEIRNQLNTVMSKAGTQIVRKQKLEKVN